jgi:hypothetical protein
MDDLRAHPLPDAITEKIFIFHDRSPANGLVLNDLLAMLQEYFGVPTLIFCPVDQPPPDGNRLVIMPLERAKRHLGDRA